MRVFIVGKLGEIVKKVLELEDVIRENPTNQILLAELASYNEVLNAWPVLDSVLIHSAIQIFKLNIAKLKQAEMYLRKSPGYSDTTDLGNYFKYLDAVRSDLLSINEIGMHIGESPWMELTDDKVAKSEDQYTISFSEC